jgi:Uma2 family endonuclease
MTLEQFERLPEGPPYFDYINGEAIEVNRPTGRHQHIEMYLAFALREHCRKAKLGEVYPEIDVRLPQGHWVGPDIVFIALDHLDWYDEEKGDLLGRPDLAVEISSPTTMAYDRVEKLEQYRIAGTPWVWIVDQDSLTIEEFSWTPEGYLRVAGVAGGQVFRPRLFPELEIDLKSLLGE